MNTVAIRRFRFPQLAVGRFLAKRTARMALIWGFVFGLSALSTALTFAKAYPSEVARQQLAASFGENVGLRALVGAPQDLHTVAGFTEWRVVGLITIIGAIWGLLTTTKLFRGEEAAGRWEVLLSGKTTARRATVNAFGALAIGLMIAFVITLLMTVVAGRNPDVAFPMSACLVFAMTLILSATEFMAVGAFTSQLMPVRARAAALAAGVFGVSFLLRAIGNVAPEAHWLVYVSPLGWIEQLHPLTGWQPVWLLPIGGFVAVLTFAAIFLAGKRDLGASIVADKDSAKPRTSLLGSPIAMAFRLTRSFNFGWFAALSVFGFVLGSLAKSAGEAFSASATIKQIIQQTTAATDLVGAKIFLGILFLMVMTLLMVFTAGSLSALREDEAEGYLDNLLVRRVARLRWLLGRIALIVLATSVAATLIALAMWAGSTLQHSGVSFGQILQASGNAVAPALFLLGIGVLIFGFWPRLTSPLVYGIIAWSFLVQMLGSIGDAGKWLLNTSILHHVALAPAVQPHWSSAALLGALGAVATVIGAWRFNSRDVTGN